jgi:prepilin-type N-terminal cleavage/methylation domain-containing protein
MFTRSKAVAPAVPASENPFLVGRDFLGTGGGNFDRGRLAWGFTLIELMIVVAVIAFVTAATIPSFSAALLQNRQREAGALIVEAVFSARSRAARTGRCHRVSVMVSDPSVKSGGFGGVVAVHASNQFNCAQADNTNVWDVISIKAIGQGAPGGLAGIVGEDVAITRMWTNNNGLWFIAVIPGGGTTMLFEPTGGLFGMQQRSYEIQSFRSDGQVIGNSKFVNILSGGSVQYSPVRQ